MKYFKYDILKNNQFDTHKQILYYFYNMLKIISFFKKPFPYPTTKKAKLLISIYCSLLAFIMILLFKPGQRFPLPFINNILFALIHSFLAFFILFLSQVFLQKFFIKNKISYLNLIIWLFFNSFLIAHGNYILGIILFHNPIGFIFYLELVLGTISTASIIFILVILIYQNLRLNKQIEKQNLLIYKSNQREQITIQSDNPNNNIIIDSKQLVYIEAMENYILIHYIDQNGFLKQKTLRTTMKKTEKTLKHNPMFFRCHRSYLINKEYIIKINKKTHYLELILSINDIAIPVSRKFNHQIKSIFSKKSIY
jgi:hypothetical protein